jgi:hypothetical protein
MQMANAATQQAIEIGKDKLREFLENSETARQALAMPAKEGKDSDSISMDTLDSRGKMRERVGERRVLKGEENDDDDF